MSEADSRKHQITIGIASNAIRQKSLSQLPLDIEYISLIHPSVQISKWVNVGRGAVITAGCILTCAIEIGEFVQLNVNTTICHDCTIGDFFTTAPAVNINGNCTIASDVYFGCGSATKQGISICSNVIVGMGAMVIKDITEPGTYIGIPAKKLLKGN
jgi:sugar O-acyltransferase (sialic acid O-acetyltransferase NeuD family)